MKQVLNDREGIFYLYIQVLVLNELYMYMFSAVYHTTSCFVYNVERESYVFCAHVCTSVHNSVTGISALPSFNSSLIMCTSHRNPSIHEELSHFAASYLRCSRQLSFQEKQLSDSILHRDSKPFTLSPPGSSELAVRRSANPLSTTPTH